MEWKKWNGIIFELVTL